MPDLYSFHEGELAVQHRAGEQHNASLNSRLIATSIASQALAFISEQPWAVLGGLDFQDHLWCTALGGGAGFITPAPDGTEVRFNLCRSPVHPANPLLPGLVTGQALGSLFIDLATRRRLRVNGRVAQISKESLQLTVEESFPNCPKFIQKRIFSGALDETASGPEHRHGRHLGAAEQAWILSADTLFLATMHPERGTDASHRGGKRGFIQVVDDTTLRLPDYPGNSFFQSFGNLEVDPRMGMLIPAFETGALLHLSGTGEVIWGAPDPENLTGGTGRFLEFHVRRWTMTPSPEVGPRWSFVEPSPFNV